VIHKSSDAADPNNYRGITITSSVGNVFNSILKERLDSFLKQNNIIDDCQIGFTRKARTSDHMFILKCIIDQYRKTKDGKVFACFVDFPKAFDKVIHTGIKLKLLEIGVSSRFYNILKNMYSYSTSCVKINDKLTELFATKLGVKQGDNLSLTYLKYLLMIFPVISVTQKTQSF
jgi:hypothetical protein